MVRAGGARGENKLPKLGKERSTCKEGSERKKRRKMINDTLFLEVNIHKGKALPGSVINRVISVPSRLRLSLPFMLST